MHENDIKRLSDLLEGFIHHHFVGMDGESAKARVDDRLLMKALDIINESLTQAQ